MTLKLEADGVHFYCSSPELTRRLIEHGARVIGRSKGRRRTARPPTAEAGTRPADPKVPRT